MIGTTCPVRTCTLSLSWENRARSPATSPLRTVCFDIFSPPPGDSDVISQVDRLSSNETKIARRSVRIAVGAWGWSVTICMVASRVGGSATSLCQSVGRYPLPIGSLFIDREDDGMGGRVDIETDDVAQLIDEARVGGELELFHPVRLQAVRAPDALDGTRADVDDLRHHGGGPVGRLGGRVGLGERHDAFDDVRSQRRDARGACLIVQEAVVTRLHQAFLPAPHTGLRLAGPAHDLIGANTIRAQQDDLSPPDMLVRGVAIPCKRLQTAAISGLESDGNSGSHAPDSHASSPLGIPSRIQMSDAIH